MMILMKWMMSNLKPKLFIQKRGIEGQKRKEKIR